MAQVLQSMPMLTAPPRAADTAHAPWPASPGEEPVLIVPAQQELLPLQPSKLAVYKLFTEQVGGIAAKAGIVVAGPSIDHGRQDKIAGLMPFQSHITGSNMLAPVHYQTSLRLAQGKIPYVTRCAKMLEQGHMAALTCVCLASQHKGACRK